MGRGHELVMKHLLFKGVRHFVALHRCGITIMMMVISLLSVGICSYLWKQVYLHEKAVYDLFQKQNAALVDVEKAERLQVIGKQVSGFASELAGWISLRNDVHLISKSGAWLPSSVVLEECLLDTEFVVEQPKEDRMSPSMLCVQGAVKMRFRTEKNDVDMKQEWERAIPLLNQSLSSTFTYRNVEFSGELAMAGQGVWDLHSVLEKEILWEE